MPPKPASHLIGPETRRLRHRAFVIDDADAFLDLNSHPDVMRYTGEPALSSIEQAAEAIETYPDFECVGFGRWASVLKETQTVVGFCGLKYLPEFDLVDVGYRYLPEYWGQGLATEACSAAVHFGLHVLGLERVFAFVMPQNIASIRVLEKSGLRYDAKVIYDGIPAHRYVTQ